MILILGATGQVGRALTALLGPDKCRALTRSEARLDHPEELATRLDRLKPSAIINAAAYTAVDLAEKEKDSARTINALAPGVLARWCAEHDIPFIHYSTDYVFSGEGDRPWQELDPIAPLNTYGATKAEGESRIAAAGGKWLIFRTSWVYDADGKNFLNTMLRFGAERETLRVVADQHGAPTYAPHLARATLQALEKALQLPVFPSGIYHLCNSGETTWHTFAQAIFEKARALQIPLKVQSVDAISSAEFPTPARRPSNSRMDLSKIRNTFSFSSDPLV